MLSFPRPPSDSFFDEVASSPVTNVTSRSNRRLWNAVVGGLEFELDPYIVIVECSVLSLTRFFWSHRCLKFSEFYTSSRICCSLMSVSSITQIPEKKLWIPRIPRMVQQKNELSIIIYSSKQNLSLFLVSRKTQTNIFWGLCKLFLPYSKIVWWLSRDFQAPIWTKSTINL